MSRHDDRRQTGFSQSVEKRNEAGTIFRPHPQFPFSFSPYASLDFLSFG